VSVKVKIYGAGSIGNHLAFGCRNQGWDVMMCDRDPEALRRTKEEIYPARYGGWDGAIRLAAPEDAVDECSDVVIIGTPPDSHVEIALKVLESAPPKVMLIEKPLCGPGLEGADDLRKALRSSGVMALIGYNHILTPNTCRAVEIIKSGKLGDPRTISVTWREHWGGIFGAHPWLAGPSDSYLGYMSKGGGACAEHSHGINIFQYFCRTLGQQRIEEVTAVMDRVSEKGSVDYDQIVQINTRSSTGLVGSIVQDVVTKPPQKQVRIQGTEGALEWYANWDSGKDAVRWWTETEGWTKEIFDKDRPADFEPEILHIKQLLEGEADFEESPLNIERGFDTMLAISAAGKSAMEGRRVKIAYDNVLLASAVL